MLIGRLTLLAAGAATVTAMAMVSAPAFAQGALQDQLAVCARISKSSARLNCYDSVAQANPQGSAAPGASGFGSSSMRAAPPAPPAASGSPSSTFGAESVERRAPIRDTNDGTQETNIAVISSRDNGLAMWQFVLADGGVWRMTERDTNFRPPAPNETVRIRKAALGSYLMEVGKQSSVRVERIR